MGSFLIFALTRLSHKSRVRQIENVNHDIINDIINDMNDDVPSRPGQLFDSHLINDMNDQLFDFVL